MTRSVIVQPGDTLWGIAQRELGNPSRWREIFADNAQAIEATKRCTARQKLAGPDWIFPGTSLELRA